MGFDTVYVNPFHLAGCSRSLYSIKDTTLLDPRFQNTPDDGDEAIKLFCDEARRNDLIVMIDLVVNHAARDSVLVETRPELFAREADGGLVTPWAADIGAEGGKVFLARPRSFQLRRSGNEPQADQSLGRLRRPFPRSRYLVIPLRCGAYGPGRGVVGAHLQSEDARPRLRFSRRDLGCTVERTSETAQVGFDYIMSNFAYSDFEHLHVLEEYERLHTLAPSVAFPESHDTDRLAARFDARDTDGIARELIFRYMLAAFFSTGVMMPMGYEWGYRKRLDVAKSSPHDQEQTGVDISLQIAEVNRLRRGLSALNVEGDQTRLSAPHDPVLVLLRGDENLMQHSEHVSLVVANVSDASRFHDVGFDLQEG